MGRWHRHWLPVLMLHHGLSAIYLRCTSMARTEKPHPAPGPERCDWELTAVTQGRAEVRSTLSPPLLHTALGTATSCLLQNSSGDHGKPHE